MSSRLDSLIQDFGSLLKQAGASVLPSPLPGSAMLEQRRVVSVAFLRSKRLGNSLLQQTHGQRCYNVSGTSYKLLDEDVTTYQEQVAGRRCYNVSGMACKLLDEDVTTYLKWLASCWTKMLQRIRNGLQVAGRRCYNVSGTSYKLLDEDVTTYQEIVIDNAGHRTLLHPPKSPPKHTRKPTPKKDNRQT